MAPSAARCSELSYRALALSFVHQVLVVLLRDEVIQLAAHCGLLGRWVIDESKLRAIRQSAIGRSTHLSARRGPSSVIGSLLWASQVGTVDVQAGEFRLARMHQSLVPQAGTIAHSRLA